MTITLAITDEDIAKGIPGDCGLCPVALVLLRLPTVAAVTVFPVSACIRTDSGERWRAQLPEELRDWIGNFDGHEAVPTLTTPLTFERVS